MDEPKLRFRNFTEKWVSKKLDEIFSIRSSSDLKNEILSENITDTHLYPVYGNSISNEGLMGYYPYYEEEAPALTVTGRGVNIGTPFFRNLNFNAVGRLLVLHPIHEGYSALFFSFLISKISIYNETTGVPQLTAPALGKYMVKIPLADEQNKISSFLNTIEKRIQLQQGKIDLLKEQKKGYMEKIFNQELRFKDEYGHSYTEWKEYKLNNIGSTFTGLSGKTKEDFGYGDHSFITYTNVFNNLFASKDGLEKVNVLEKENQAIVKKGDILLTTSSETPFEVGMASIWIYSMEKVHLNSFCFGYRLNKSENILAEFIAISLRSDYMRKKIVLLAQGSTRYNMSKTELMVQTIMIPCVGEQLKIVNFYKSLEQKLILAMQQLENLKTQKQAFMQQMFI